jgi:hypothetical protein
MTVCTADALSLNFDYFEGSRKYLLQYLCCLMYLITTSAINPLTPKLIPSVQRSLPIFITGDFAS